MLEHYPLSLVGTEQMIPVPFSFETNEIGAFNLPLLPYRCKLKRVESAVSKTVAGTNSGTVVIKNGATSLATVTVAASAAIGDEDEAPSVSDTPFELDEQISITTAKSTAGGRGMLYLTVEVLPSH